MEMHNTCTRTRERWVGGWDLSEQFSTCPASFLIDFAWGKAEGEFTNHSHVMGGHYKYCKCKSVTKCPDHNHMTVGAFRWVELWGLNHNLFGMITSNNHWTSSVVNWRLIQSPISFSSRLFLMIYINVDCCFTSSFSIPISLMTSFLVLSRQSMASQTSTSTFLLGA